MTVFGVTKAGKVVCKLTNEQQTIQDAMPDGGKTCSLSDIVLSTRNIFDLTIYDAVIDDIHSVITYRFCVIALIIYKYVTINPNFNI